MRSIKKIRAHSGLRSASLYGAAFLLAVLLVVLSGCAAHKVGPTSILQAQKEIPESQLLDVGILPFGSAELTAKQAEGAHPDIRRAEGNFMAVHLKDTLQRSAQWGAVRVVPSETSSMDVLIKGKILQSNGETLSVQITATDASGRTWLKKTYAAEATTTAYSGSLPGEIDVYQDLYNAIANDLATFRMRLTPDQAKNLRTVAQLKFAQDFAPKAFANHLITSRKGLVSVNRLPAGDDTMMRRLLDIREREYMYLDALNGYYDNFYTQMWPSYENWRKLNREERVARRRIKRKALTRQLVGALMVAGAIALGAGDVDNTGVLQAGMIVVGSQVIVNGFNISREAQIHSEAIQELGDTFGSEMKPVTMDLEGKQVELTGSAKEQFEKWKALLRQIYQAETGFGELPEQPAPGED